MSVLTLTSAARAASGVVGEQRMEPKEWKQVERSVQETVADANSPTAQRFIRGSFKKNKFTSALMLLILLTPSAFLLSFYSSKFVSIWEKWRDPYELPPGFDPKTGRFVSKDAPKQRTEPPSALVLKSLPGQ
ncbi:hypothetical protein TraAM80_00169 [Trypanosoma rangeli]|uniref:Transmembrane protein n=1 Tax=Trypanosoma rangeli TaxID=5698 RepID=A0A3R7MC34_TRYRA|nr:uncharacterized protein TraAM80_00169 [Trypanosoma rangeli]RNF12626.1 hypothetical protein TraAM80_00169 [Trypanosoma rangeli]|eukprot:RNF12626.1 hypothetical protein TraAM80_00169 [Trypanosoma rangeli]